MHRRIGIQHIEPTQEIVVELGQLGILETAFPVVCHQLKIGLDSIQTVHILTTGIEAEITSHRLQGITEVALQQTVVDSIQ